MWGTSHNKPQCGSDVRTDSDPLVVVGAECKSSQLTVTQSILQQLATAACNPQITSYFSSSATDLTSL